MSATTFVRMPTNKQLLTMGLPDLPEDAFGGTGPRLTPIARAIGGKQPALYGGGGGGLKAVVGVVAAIAIPIAAPAIAGAIGTSLGVTAATFGLSATAGSVIGSAIVGAGLGAVTAKVTGGDVGRGALFGAIGGGAGGYADAISSTAAQTGTATSAPGATVAGAAPTAPTGVITPGMSQAEMLAAQEAGFYGAGQMSQQAQMLAAQDAGLGAQLSSSPTAYGYNAPTAGLDTATAGVAGSQTVDTSGMTQQQRMLAEQQAGFDVPPPSTVSQQQQMLAAQDAAFGVSPTNATTALGYQAPTQTTLGALGERVVAGAKDIGTQITKKFTDPKQQADMILKAAGQIAGSYMAPDGMSPEEKALLDQQRQELEQLRSTNQELFQEKLNAARQLVQDANYFDPEYFGLQRARQVQQAGAKVERERLAGIDPRRANLRAAEQRRTRLATGRDVGTAYDTGFTAATQARNQARTAGLNLYPTAPTTALQYGYNLGNLYSGVEERKRKARESTGAFFDSLFS